MHKPFVLAAFLTCAAVCSIVAIASLPSSIEAKTADQDPLEDYEFTSLSQAIGDGYFVEFPVWLPEHEVGGLVTKPAGWYTAVRMHDEPGFLSDQNPFKGYEFTTLEQALADGYYVKFPIWVPARALDNGLVVPGRWSWAIRRYDEPEYSYPPADHIMPSD